MDTVIFTGKVPVEEYKDDRPREFEELEQSGKLDEFTSNTSFSDRRMKVIKFFGYVFLFAGIILVLLIIYSLLFH
jgi:hypothetical protein